MLVNNVDIEIRAGLASCSLTYSNMYKYVMLKLVLTKQFIKCIS